MRIIDGDELYQKVVGYNGGAVDKTVAKRLIDQMPTIDAVSRQAAIDALIKWYGCEPSDIGAFENIIEKLPSAQPERKKGRWVRITKDTAKCSVCDDYIDNAISCGYNYCPNCGCEMER